MLMSMANTLSRLRLRLHRHGFQSKRFHDLETASKKTRFQRVYREPIQPLIKTVYVKAISFSGLCASSIGSRFDQTWVRRLSSPSPNPESSFGFNLRYSARAYRRKSQHFKTSLPVIAVWLSVYSKIHESSKSEVKPQIKVVIVQQSAPLRERFTIFTPRASQFRARPFLNRCGFTVYTTSKPYPLKMLFFWKRIQNDPILIKNSTGAV